MTKTAISEILDVISTNFRKAEVDSLLTTKSLAKILDISPGAIMNMRSQGNTDLPPHIIIGKRLVRYRIQDVVEWIQGKAQENGRMKL